MNDSIFSGKWKQFKGKVKEKWGKLTDDDLTRINGKREQMLGSLQERYGWQKQRAEDELNRFEQSCCKRDDSSCEPFKKQGSKSEFYKGETGEGRSPQEPFKKSGERGEFYKGENDEDTGEHRPKKRKIS